jgi:hypothetical protein
MREKGNLMTKGLQLKFRCAVLGLACVALVVSLVPARHAQAAPGGSNGDSKIQIGFAAVPSLVHLNMKGKNPALVGLGSYYVNVTSDCNGCHSNGPQTEYVSNPYFGAKEEVNPATYLGGGRNFGPLIPGSYPIISRNLTPDKSGLPEGGSTFDDFVQHMRTGIDDDHLHPTCAPGVVAPNCIPAPFNGNLLQIMPWPNYKHLSDHDLRAIYEYLRAVPCIHGNYPGEDPDRCG